MSVFVFPRTLSFFMELSRYFGRWCDNLHLPGGKSRASRGSGLLLLLLALELLPRPPSEPQQASEKFPCVSSGPHSSTDHWTSSATCEVDGCPEGLGKEIWSFFLLTCLRAGRWAVDKIEPWASSLGISSWCCASLIHGGPHIHEGVECSPAALRGKPLVMKWVFQVC